MGFLFSVNVYVLFLWCFFYGEIFLKIVKSGYTWEWVRFSSLGFKNLAQRAAKYNASLCYITYTGMLVY